MKMSPMEIMEAYNRGLASKGEVRQLLGLDKPSVKALETREVVALAGTEVLIEELCKREDGIQTVLENVSRKKLAKELSRRHMEMSREQKDLDRQDLRNHVLSSVSVEMLIGELHKRGSLHCIGATSVLSLFPVGVLLEELKGRGVGIEIMNPTEGISLVNILSMTTREMLIHELSKHKGVQVRYLEESSYINLRKEVILLPAKIKMITVQG